MQPTTSPVPPTGPFIFSDNFVDGGTYDFDELGMLFLDLTAKSGPGLKMGDFALITSWGLDDDGTGDGTKSLEAGTFIFNDPYYADGPYTIEATATDQSGNRTAVKVTVNLKRGCGNTTADPYLS